MRIERRQFPIVAIIALLAGSWSYPCFAHHAVLRFNLEEMTQTADRIFIGRCVDVVETEEFIAKGMMPVTRYTFEVQKVIKGKVPKLVTFLQLGHRSRSLVKGGGPTMHGEGVSTNTFIHGMSEYSVGERVLLFLIPDYLDGKVTYPVGLYQGAFRISRTPSGRELVRNSINNIGLFSAPYNRTRMTRADARVILPESASGAPALVDGLARKRGALPLDQFLEAVEQIHTAHGGQKGAILQ